jgi:hypothetical protein
VLLGAFLARRTRCHAVSSIGFVGDSSLWGIEDPSNRVRTLDGDFGLRHRPRPINVLEPVVDLERALRAGCDRRWRTRLESPPEVQHASIVS